MVLAPFDAVKAHLNLFRRSPNLELPVLRSTTPRAPLWILQSLSVGLVSGLPVGICARLRHYSTTLPSIPLRTCHSYAWHRSSDACILCMAPPSSAGRITPTDKRQSIRPGKYRGGRKGGSRWRRKPHSSVRGFFTARQPGLTSGRRRQVLQSANTWSTAGVVHDTLKAPSS